MSSPSNRILAVLWSVVVTTLISVFGAGVWTALITSNLATTPAIPWAVAVMASVLWLLWQYLGGRWWPRSTAGARHANLRANRVSGPVLAWALGASILALIALAGLWIVLVELTGAGGNLTIPD